MQNLILILDGIQDITYPELENKTPLEAGKGESFEKIFSQSQTGKFVTTPQGFEADTQTCTLTLLGVSPSEIPSGRSYTEALAQGIDVGDDDIIMRLNFVEVSSDGLLKTPCCSAPDDVAKVLRDTVAAIPGNKITPVGSYKSLQLIEGGAKYIDTLVTHMPHQNALKPFESLLPTGNELADRLAEFSRFALNTHNPYAVLNWGAAIKADLPQFSSLHKGKSGGMVSKTDALIGLAKAMGMECIAPETATGDTDTDLAAKLTATIDLLKTNDMVVLHIGGTDEATHRQDAVEKAEFISKLDKELIEKLIEKLPQGAKILLTCDHMALCKTAGHTSEPVDFWLWQKGNEQTGDFGTLDGRKAVEIIFG